MNNEEKILSMLDTIMVKVSNLDDKVSNLDDKVSNLDDKVSNLDARVSNLDVKVDNLDDKVSNLDARVCNLEQGQIHIIQRLDVVEVDIAEMKLDIRYLRRASDEAFKDIDIIGRRVGM